MTRTGAPPEAERTGDIPYSKSYVSRRKYDFTALSISAMMNGCFAVLALYTVIMNHCRIWTFVYLG
ncbi:hypothetical protein E2320_015026 [Naja naja]|nr:hypothetical protein E2320_015026 [Naja naja]